ncbi:Histone-lysine N-methyltransferase set9 [Gamsiella multidivaricata]|nr:Histone-lysine N-methyltransferase set9 [Gamsiella multidivaricata]
MLDDLLSDILLDGINLWFQTHKMNKDYRPMCLAPEKILDIIQCRVVMDRKVHEAVKDLLEIESVKKLFKTDKEIQDFTTHARRYLNIYLPMAGFEISQTDRYSAVTNKSEACVIANRSFEAGFELRYCAGTIAILNEQEEKDLENRTSDFSVIKTSRRGTCLFLGPARFVNHDCDPNCSFMSAGSNVIYFKVLRRINVNDEITTHYGDNYFGVNNQESKATPKQTRTPPKTTSPPVEFDTIPSTAGPLTPVSQIGSEISADDPATSTTSETHIAASSDKGTFFNAHEIIEQEGDSSAASAEPTPLLMENSCSIPDQKASCDIGNDSPSSTFSIILENDEAVDKDFEVALEGLVSYFEPMHISEIIEQQEDEHRSNNHTRRSTCDEQDDSGPIGAYEETETSHSSSKNFRMSIDFLCHSSARAILEKSVERTTTQGSDDATYTSASEHSVRRTSESEESANDKSTGDGTTVSLGPIRCKSCKNTVPKHEMGPSMECRRCHRHFSIYGVTWPSRSSDAIVARIRKAEREAAMELKAAQSALEAERLKQQKLTAKSEAKARQKQIRAELKMGVAREKEGDKPGRRQLSNKKTSRSADTAHSSYPLMGSTFDLLPSGFRYPTFRPLMPRAASPHPAQTTCAAEYSWPMPTPIPLDISSIVSVDHPFHHAPYIVFVDPQDGGAAKFWWLAVTVPRSQMDPTMPQIMPREDGSKDPDLIVVRFLEDFKYSICNISGLKLFHPEQEPYRGYVSFYGREFMKNRGVKRALAYLSGDVPSGLPWRLMSCHNQLSLPEVAMATRNTELRIQEHIYLVQQLQNHQFHRQSLQQPLHFSSGQVVPYDLQYQEQQYWNDSYTQHARPQQHLLPMTPEQHQAGLYQDRPYEQELQHSYSYGQRQQQQHGLEDQEQWEDLAPSGQQRIQQRTSKNKVPRGVGKKTILKKIEEITRQQEHGNSASAVLAAARIAELKAALTGKTTISRPRFKAMDNEDATALSVSMPSFGATALQVTTTFTSASSLIYKPMSARAGKNSTATAPILEKSAGTITAQDPTGLELKLKASKKSKSRAKPGSVIWWPLELSRKTRPYGSLKPRSDNTNVQLCRVVVNKAPPRFKSLSTLLSAKQPPESSATAEDEFELAYRLLEFTVLGATLESNGDFVNVSQADPWACILPTATSSNQVSDESCSGTPVSTASTETVHWRRRSGTPNPSNSPAEEVYDGDYIDITGPSSPCDFSAVSAESETCVSTTPPKPFSSSTSSRRKKGAGTKTAAKRSFRGKTDTGVNKSRTKSKHYRTELERLQVWTIKDSLPRDGPGSVRNRSSTPTRSPRPEHRVQQQQDLSRQPPYEPPLQPVLQPLLQPTLKSTLQPKLHSPQAHLPVKKSKSELDRLKEWTIMNSLPEDEAGADEDEAIEQGYLAGPKRKRLRKREHRAEASPPAPKRIKTEQHSSVDTISTSSEAHNSSPAPTIEVDVDVDVDDDEDVIVNVDVESPIAKASEEIPESARSSRKNAAKSPVLIGAESSTSAAVMAASNSEAALTLIRSKELQGLLQWTIKDSSIMLDLGSNVRSVRSRAKAPVSVNGDGSRAAALTPDPSHVVAFSRQDSKSTCQSVPDTDPRPADAKANKPSKRRKTVDSVAHEIVSVPHSSQASDCRTKGNTADVISTNQSTDDQEVKPLSAVDRELSLPIYPIADPTLRTATDSTPPLLTHASGSSADFIIAENSNKGPTTASLTNSVVQESPPEPVSEAHEAPRTSSMDDGTSLVASKMVASLVIAKKASEPNTKERGTNITGSDAAAVEKAPSATIAMTPEPDPVLSDEDASNPDPWDDTVSEFDSLGSSLSSCVSTISRSESLCDLSEVVLEFPEKEVEKTIEENDINDSQIQDNDSQVQDNYREDVSDAPQDVSKINAREKGRPRWDAANAVVNDAIELLMHRSRRPQRGKRASITTPKFKTGDEVVAPAEYDIPFEAQITAIRDSKTQQGAYEYKVHYKGYASRYDAWVAEKLLVAK